MKEFHDFDYDYCSRATKVLYKIGHVSIRILKRSPRLDDFFYEFINYCDVTAGILNRLSEIS